MRKFLVLLPLTSVLFACESVKFNDQQIREIREGNNVVLEYRVPFMFGPAEDIEVHVEHINGERVPYLGVDYSLKEYLMPVGRNSVRVSCKGEYYDTYISTSHDLYIHAKPHHRYFLSTTIDIDFTCVFEVREEPEKKFVRDVVEDQV